MTGAEADALSLGAAVVAIAAHRLVPMASHLMSGGHQPEHGNYRKYGTCHYVPSPFHLSTQYDRLLPHRQALRFTMG